MRIGNLESITKKSLPEYIYFKFFGLPHYGSQVRFSTIKKLMKPSKTSIILDLGCGDGSYLNYVSGLYGCSGVGVDRLDNRLKTAIAVNEYFHLNNSFIKKEANHFLSEHSGGMFDYILCIDVLEHFRDPEKVIGKCFNKLSPGGKLIISTPVIPQHKWLFNVQTKHFDYGKDKHLIEGLSEDWLLQVIRKTNGKLLYKIQTFKIIAQILWEISEKIRRFKVIYYSLVPILYLLSGLDFKLSPSGTHNGLVVVLQKR